MVNKCELSVNRRHLQQAKDADRLEPKGTWSVQGVPAVSPPEKENICAPALAFVFAWHRIGAIVSYEKQR